MVCSSERLLEKEPKYLNNVCHKINGYPWWVINQDSKSIQEKINKSSVKWSGPGHFFRAHGKFFLSFLCALFYIF